MSEVHPPRTGPRSRDGLEMSLFTLIILDGPCTVISDSKVAITGQKKRQTIWFADAPHVVLGEQITQWVLTRFDPSPFKTAAVVASEEGGCLSDN
jgi:hypothetical protein